MKNFIKNHLSFLPGLRRLFLNVRECYFSPPQLLKFGKIGNGSTIQSPSKFTNQALTYIGDFVQIRYGFQLINHTGRFFLGKYSVIAPNCTVITGNHTRTVGVPMSKSSIDHINDSEGDIIIEEDTWIGANVTILPGAHIGRGAIIGACSLVNNTIPPYSVVVGTPAKIISYTFSIPEILEHEKALYVENERMSKEDLEILFSQYFKGLSPLGHRNVTNSTQK